MADLRVAEVERIADAMTSTLSGFSEMLGVPPLEWMRELAAEMADDLALMWSAAAVMADGSQPIGSES
ncbi:hypothetical protein OG874_00450 [Nocardia sp. NBC_00565]|uniref:hypothetical protein n=1 Tax=Nocardia sp. NBC_00565 TaxID=2975993 RepID=UPI002E820087|nr:hypothetical protein [Nocardia sp. NBC_00565]WUC03725.1 hypothetical protein OG874_00450 [Nocardia sp. NBC_00565]